jgi:uncharacterized protein YegL
MKKGLTEIVYILDQSGSMSNIKSDAIGGFNSFLNEQKSVEGEANMTIIFFDHEYIVYNSGQNLQSVEPLNDRIYVPRGNTGLYDAVGKTIVDVGNRLAETPENERPERVIIAIFTDGEENCSKLYTAEDIGRMIEHQQTAYNWEFMYLGCNQDAMLTAKRMGIHNYANVGYTTQGMDSMYSTLSRSVSGYRSCGIVDQLPTDIK